MKKGVYKILKGFQSRVADFIHKPGAVEDVKAQLRLKKVIDDQNWAYQKTNESIKLLYKELENKNKQLRQLDQVKDEFVSNVSHELRTPLTIIRESIQQVSDGLFGEVNEKQNKYLIKSLVNVDRLSKIINDLLDIAIIENGQLKLCKEKVDMIELVQEVVSNFTLQVQKKGLEIKTVVPKGKVNVFVDKEKMIQVLTNLVGNAYKFTEKGYIEISVFENDASVECRVKDTGIGIASRDLPRLFLKFEQVARESGSGPKGTGLGLSISKSIIQLHDGQITVESKLGEGTQFIMTLPKLFIPDDMQNLVDCLRENTQKYNNYSVLVFRIQNFDAKFNELLNSLEAVIKQQLYRGLDQTVKNKGSVYVILPNTKKEDARIVVDRIYKTIDVKKWKEQSKDFTGLVFDIVHWPEDVRTEMGLLDKLQINREEM